MTALVDLARGVQLVFRPSVAGSHEHRRELTDDASGMAVFGDPVPPLLAWPTRD